MLPVQPKILSQPFCVNGARNTIPANSEDNSGLASLEHGFPTITELPIVEGGLPPQRKDFNGILYLLSAFAFWAQSGGLYTYNQELAYVPPAMVYYKNKLYVCTASNGIGVAAGTKAPDENPDYWVDVLKYIGGLTADEIQAKIDKKVNDSIAAIPKPKVTALGKYTNVGTSGTAQTDGFLSGSSSHNSSVAVLVNGLEVYFTAGRSKYGQGSVGFCVPVPKGARWQINGGTNYVRWIPLGN